VRDEALVAQFEVDVGESRLVAVDPVKSDLGLDGHSPSEPDPPGAERRKFAALDVDLEEVDVGNLGDLVQPVGLHLLTAGHPGQPGKVDEQVELGLIRLQQAGETRGGAQVQRVPATVTDGVGQVPLVRSGPATNVGQRRRLRLEAGDPAVSGVQQRMVGRVATDRIGTDVDDLDRRPAGSITGEPRRQQIVDRADDLGTGRAR